MESVYRAYHKKSGGFLYWEDLMAMMDGLKVSVLPRPTLRVATDRSAISEKFVLSGNPFRHQDLELERYLPILDRNGRQICENDIVDFGFGPGVVQFNKNSCTWNGISMFHSSNREYKIIGNIHHDAFILNH